MFSRITIKVGSNVITKSDGTLDEVRMEHLVEQIAQIKKHGTEVVLVSSGAIAAGRGIVVDPIKTDSVSTRQLWSAVGQVNLINIYSKLLAKHQLICAQILTTKENFSDRRHYLNMRNCFHNLFENNIIPVVNENDAISVTELMFTDNDELAGLIASMVNSEALFILSNVDGIYNGDPNDENSTIIKELTSDVKELNIISDKKSGFGRGGMITKFSIARKVAKSGIAVFIANGTKNNSLVDIFFEADTALGTRFVPEKRSSNVKNWISYSEGFEKGKVFVNKGAKDALTSDKPSSLLLIGVTKIDGEFKKGDVIKIFDENGQVIGFGQTKYDSVKARKCIGQKDCKPLVHYDYLYLTDN